MWMPFAVRDGELKEGWRWEIKKVVFYGLQLVVIESVIAIVRMGDGCVGLLQSDTHKDHTPQIETHLKPLILTQHQSHWEFNRKEINHSVTINPHSRVYYYAIQIYPIKTIFNRMLWKETTKN